MCDRITVSLRKITSSATKTEAQQLVVPHSEWRVLIHNFVVVKLGLAS
jgi:hypothetical protein